MTTCSVTPTEAPTPNSYRVRVALSSPDIMAHIRAIFADRGYDAQFEGHQPVFELVVKPGGGAAPGAAGLGDALVRLVGDRPRSAPIPRAPYRLALVGSARDEAHPVRTAEPTDRPSTSGAAALSTREAEVMGWIAHGLRNCDVAAELGVSPKTVKNHVNRIFAKLEVSTRVEAVLAWQSQRPEAISAVQGPRAEAG